MYELLTDLNVLHEAYMQCKKDVEWKESVQRYGMNELINIAELSERLKNRTYRQKPFYEFDINERGKRRHIKSLHISDRVLQRALCDNILVPLTRKYLIYDNGASVKGKGIAFTRRRLQAHLEKFYRRYGRNGYVLQIDFSKYFDNIDHKELLRMFARLIDDADVMRLFTELIETFSDKGVGIGSQISQIIGIYYPTEIDNWCKVVRGCRYYGRYMDDTYIIHQSKEFLRGLLAEIERLCAKLGIIINRKKTQIIKLTQGFIFLKIRYVYSKCGRIIKIPCRKSITRERRKLRKFRNLVFAGRMKPEEVRDQYKSWRGNIIRYNAYKSVRSTDALYKSLFRGTEWTNRNAATSRLA